MERSNNMAMFNLELGGDQQVKKPMRSYIDIDENGRPKARIYADEYDSVKSNPDFQPYLTGAGKNMQTAQDTFAEEMNNARLDDVEKRIKAKRQETIKAETEARQVAGTTNEYPGLDIYGRLTGGETFSQRATSRQEQLKKLLEERAGYMGTPEISAPMPQADERVEPTKQATATQAAPTERYVRVKGPQGKTGKYPKSAWEKNSRNLIEQGYILLP